MMIKPLLWLTLSALIPLSAVAENEEAGSSVTESNQSVDSTEIHGDPAALFLSARRYLLGDGVAKDPKKSLELMLKSAELGYGPALGGVGYFYSVGLAVSKNDDEAVRWFRQGADKGVPRAQFNLAQMLLAGRGVSQNWSEGITWLTKAAEQDMPEALFALADAYFMERFGMTRDNEKAFQYYRKAAELGHVAAQNAVGVMYRFGQGTPADYAMAKTWFLTAANVNDAKAQSNLGQMYLGGIGVDQSRAEATFWLKLAARQGDPAAARLLDGLLPTIPSDELRSIDERIVKWQKGGFSGPKSSAP